MSEFGNKSKLQVLVATVHNDDSEKLINMMNLQGSIIIANQSDENSIRTITTDKYKFESITTKTRGVGINRNIALALSTEDYLLFSDDDVCYVDNYISIVEKAFDSIPNADVIIFQLDYYRKGKLDHGDHYKTKRIPIWRSLKYGTAKIAVKRLSLLKNRICFSELFGGGSLYGSGEDSLFLIDCFKHHLKVYTYAMTIGKTTKDSSSWFSGYDNKYFYDKGAFLACGFPHFSRVLAMRFAYRFRRMTNLSFLIRLSLLLKGIRGFTRLLSYSELEKVEERVHN